MISPQQQDFLTNVYQAAVAAGHIFPAACACEAAVESAWGSSRLCVEANNLFGLKTPHDWTGPTVAIPTREFLHGQWAVVGATWPVFSDYAACLRERMTVLQSNHCYAAALAAPNPPAYLRAVSTSWATDPSRAEVCIAIYNAHGSALTLKKA